MSRNSKIITGILSFLPLIMLFVVLIKAFSMFPEFFYWDRHEPDPYIVFSTLWPLIIISIIAAIIKLGALIFFIIHMLNNARVHTNERVIWVLVFIFTGGVGYPIYWYMRIWREDALN